MDQGSPVPKAAPADRDTAKPATTETEAAPDAGMSVPRAQPTQGDLLATGAPAVKADSGTVKLDKPTEADTHRNDSVAEDEADKDKPAPPAAS